MQEEINENQSADWRDEVCEALDVLKIMDKEVATFVFKDEGTRNLHPDFGASIKFKVEHIGEEKTWYVNANNFALQKQIKDLGPLVGMKVSVKRTGDKRSNTRYTIQKVE